MVFPFFFRSLFFSLGPRPRKKKKKLRYHGEWYEPKSAGDHVPSYDAQRRAAVSNCWKVAWMYAACGAASAAALALGGRRR